MPRRVFVCGCGHDGRLGLGNEKNCCSPVPLRFFEDNNLEVESVVVGGFHNFVVTTAGVYAFGLGEQGQLGLGECANVMKPRLVAALDRSRLVQLHCGAYHTVAWMSDGLYVCGGNSHGQLGLGDFADQKHFTRVPSIDPAHIVAISCGSFHTLVLLRDMAIGDDDPNCASVERGASGALEAVERVRVVPLVIAACGKGDFGELGYDADSWDALASQERLLQSQMAAKAKHTAMGGLDANFHSDIIEQQAAAAGPVSGGSADGVRRPFVFKRPPNQKKRRTFFNHPVLKAIKAATPADVTEIKAMHHHSAFATADGRVWDFGCYFDGSIEGDESSLPRPFPFANIHCGEDIVFGWNSECGAPLQVMGIGNLGCGNDDDEAKMWRTIALPQRGDSGPPTVERITGKTHFLITVRYPGQSEREVLVFGDNFMTQLGIGREEEKVAAPEPLPRPAGADGSRLAAALAGFRHTVLVFETL